MSFSDKPKLLCDENIPERVTELLIKEGFDVKKVPLGSADKQISKTAKLESGILLTFDKHFVNRRLYPPKEYQGIIFLDIHPPIIDTIFSSLSKLFKKLKPLEFKGKVFILSQLGFRVKG